MVSLVRILTANALLAVVVLAQESTSDLIFDVKQPTLESSIGTFSAEDTALFGFPISKSPSAVSCKTFPVDENWPSEDEWSRLNATTKGALMKTIPLAAPCYPGPISNDAKCAAIAAQWGISDLQYDIFLST